MQTELTSSSDGSIQVCNNTKTTSYTHSMIFLDWDDTLFPSTYLASKGYRLDCRSIATDVLKELAEIEELVTQFLDIVSQNAEVYIVTNAEHGWVELSAAKFLPRVASKLRNIHIISARTKYEALWPNSPYDWKLQTFKERISRYVLPNLTLLPFQVISFGDSNFEREAVRSATQNHNLDCKIVKLYERPTVEQLLRQIELIVRSYSVIFSHAGHLDMRLSIFE